MIKKRNVYIDILKVVAATLVVVIHATAFIFYDGFKTFMNYDIFRQSLNIAVPIFFAVSGYFLSNKNYREIIEYAKKIFLLYIFSSIFYIFYKLMREVARSIMTNSNPLAAIKPVLSMITIPKIINGSFGHYHLWFLAILTIACLLIAFFVKKRYSIKNIFLISLTFYIFIIGEVIKISFILIDYKELSRALAFITLGMFIAQARSVGNKIEKKPRKYFVYFLFLFITFIALGWLEMLGMMPILLYLAVYYLILAVVTSFPIKENKLSGLGKYSVWIYILHSFFLENMDRLYTLFHINKMSYYPFYILVIIGSAIFLSVIFAKPIEKIFKRFCGWMPKFLKINSQKSLIK